MARLHVVVLIRNILMSNCTVTDNLIFKLHYRFTSIVIALFGILLLIQLYFYKPLYCISQDDISPETLEAYCFAQSTFSVAGFFGKEVGREIVYPGVEKYKRGQVKVNHTYYQYVCFFMLFQAFFFYVPRFFWKFTESGKLNNILRTLDCPFSSEDQVERNRGYWITYLMFDTLNQNIYFLCYIFSEVLNFINVIAQIFWLDWFLGGNFRNYGHNVLHFSGDGVDPQTVIFPRLSKCTFYKYGSSGDVQQYDALCVLKLNHINDKIFLYIWFWFIFLAVISAMVIFYRILVVILPPVRYYILSFRARLVNRGYLNVVARRCSLGNWMIINLLCKNMEPINFSEFITEFAKRLEGKGKHEDVELYNQQLS